METNCLNYFFLCPRTASNDGSLFRSAKPIYVNVNHKNTNPRRAANDRYSAPYISNEDNSSMFDLALIA